MTVLKGEKPKEIPPRSQDFEDLEKKTIDILIDSLKYIATACGIVIAIYSQILQTDIKEKLFQQTPIAQSLLFAPLLLWFLVILGTVLAIFPRSYYAKSDLERQAVINRIRNLKKNWLVVSLVFFISGFTFFLYVMFAQIWKVYPFVK